MGGCFDEEDYDYSIHYRDTDHTVILMVPNETWAQWATDHGYD